VTDRASIRTVDLTANRVRLGVEMTRDGSTGRLVRLRTVREVHLWLGVDALLYADDEGHLTVEKSAWSLFCGRDADAAILRYDYERDKEGYPAAHLQVAGRNTDLEEVLAMVGRRRSRLPHLHLPVGGKRFRPALEDLVEFLIDERLVEAKPNSKEMLERTRATYHDIQLLAAVRRRPDKAAEGLLDLGYKVSDPMVV